MGKFLPIALLLAILLSGCASPPPEEPADPGEPPVEEEPPAPPAPVSHDVHTTGNWVVLAQPIGFDPETLSATTGANVTITLHNDDVGAMHGWVLEDVDGAAIQSVSGGESGSVTFAAPAPGEYAFYCPVGDHRSRGQEGTFTITAA